MSAGTTLILDGITQRYGSALAVDTVTLDIRGGELVALLGPSGCGKTTLLRAVAGFLKPTEGRVIIGGQAVDHLPPNRRTVGIVFQNYALFPHMSVADNVAYGLAARGVGRTEQRARVAEMLALVRLEHLAGRFPREMSGGQQQRVALARALAVRPSILLLDEPFAALDKNLRLDMQIEIKRIQRSAGTTTLIVTHDQEEALSMADRVAVLNAGRLEQFAPPTDVYDRPETLFVNTFVGTANVLHGRLATEPGGARVVALEAGGLLPAATSLPDGTRVAACLRPEHVGFAEEGPGAGAGVADGLDGAVEVGLPLGATLVHEIRLDGGAHLKTAEPRAAGARPRPPGTRVRLRPTAPERVGVFPDPRH
ncbi:putative spermidine/putrescine transport system ATP-binding protein [Methylobacterium sp. UNC300MFChir4.1]|uniref:ABC transporter ATP-binding protein n=1 Tax=Methylobacterium sp. UNC300MFChir4.1 TaxID=1502747 RepID=UPI0008AE9F62|nr:ABC transporter ATP-binding protein [Methylobacterium sp. UNC300MFChir4.1]SEP07780.1 putative spermidine/putrescine transport system ATP-binding protein [Methylobacterium sp. UNC300MFChir4.1]